jgi:hypothetical protein
MSKFRKKPIVVEAVRFIEGQPLPPNTRLTYHSTGGVAGGQVYDVLHKSWISLSFGDWVITGPSGENYPVKDETFQSTYEPVVEGEIQ